MTQSAGRLTSLTWPAAMRPLAKWWLRLLFVVAHHIPLFTASLRRAEIIHFVRWTLLDRLPGEHDAPRRSILLLESDFDGQMGDYIDVFASTVRRRFTAVWFFAYGFPGLVPPLRFQQWVMSLESTSGHYYAAYPNASTTMVGQALRLQAAFDKQRSALTSADDRTIERDWNRFLTENQQCL